MKNKKTSDLIIHAARMEKNGIQILKDYRFSPEIICEKYIQTSILDEEYNETINLWNMETEKFLLEENKFNGMIILKNKYLILSTDGFNKENVFLYDITKEEFVYNEINIKLLKKLLRYNINEDTEKQEKEHKIQNDILGNLISSRDWSNINKYLESI